MHQAIKTTYYGPTNTKGARVRAKCGAKTLWINWDYGVGVTENHSNAAKSLSKSLGWSQSLITGWLGHVGVHVFFPEEIS